MQKWFPDAFETEGAGSESFKSDSIATAKVIPGEDKSFQANQLHSNQLEDLADDQASNNRLFMSESGFSGPEAIMQHLTRDERAQVFELVEQDITKEYEVREQELGQKFASDLAKAEENFNASLKSFSENMLKAISAHLKETADASARLAIQLAEKIVRSHVNSDHEILVKALETTLFKIDGAKTVIINVNPEQVDYLNNKPELLARLGINQVVADRRIDMGGCLVKTEKMEWDATIKGQLEYLGELVEEMIATGDEPDLTGKGQSSDEPKLD